MYLHTPIFIPFRLLTVKVKMDIIEVSKTDGASVIEKVRAITNANEEEPDLTNKIKHFIEEYYGQYGTSPSIRCIAENVGCSKSNVTIYIDYLKEQGLLEIGGRRIRNRSDASDRNERCCRAKTRIRALRTVIGRV